MKKMLIAAIAAAFMFTLVGTAMAKDKAATSKPAAGLRGPAAIYSKLDLTDAQTAQVKDILDQAKKDQAAAADKKAKGEIMKAANEKIRTTVLTDEQRTKLDEMKKDMKKHGAHSKPAADAPAAQ